MSRFISTSDTKDIQAEWWNDGERVTIRKWTIAQRDALNDRILRVTGSGENNLTEMQIKAAQVPVLEAGIKSWTLEDDGLLAQCNAANMGRLAPRDADFIVSAIWELNRAEPEEERESFPAEGDAGGEGEK